VLAIVVLVVAGLAYTGLRWYPRKAAGDLMRPSSEEYARAMEEYRAAVATVPEAGTEPGVVIEAASTLGGPVEAARTVLHRAQLGLEDRTTPAIPVVSDQPPLGDAVEVRRLMLRLYPLALEVMADLDGMADYVTELSRTLPQLQNIESTLRKSGAGGLGDAIAVARPIAGQLAGDLEAIVPPDELGAVHAALQAIAAQIGANLDEAAGAGGQASEPVLRALVKDVIREIRDFREAVASTPAAASEGEPGELVKRVDRLSERIEDGLAALRADGVGGITLPDQA
jgi:hypothetical protein